MALQLAGVACESARDGSAGSVVDPAPVVTASAPEPPAGAASPVGVDPGPVVEPRPVAVATPGPSPRPVSPLPPSRPGQDLIGTALPALSFDRWIDAPAADAPEPVATLYRWWTDSCPHCVASLPAVETLRTRYAAAGLRVVGVYHPKPPRLVDAAEVRAAAQARGFHGPLAVDTDWSELARFYLTTGQRPATSASFLVDARGVIRFVHPGPELHPSDDPAHADCAADFAALDAAVAALLALPAE